MIYKQAVLADTGKQVGRQTSMILTSLSFVFVIVANKPASDNYVAGIFITSVLKSMCERGPVITRKQATLSNTSEQMSLQANQWIEATKKVGWLAYKPSKPDKAKTEALWLMNLIDSVISCEIKGRRDSRLCASKMYWQIQASEQAGRQASRLADTL